MIARAITLSRVNRFLAIAAVVLVAAAVAAGTARASSTASASSTLSRAKLSRALDRYAVGRYHGHRLPDYRFRGVRNTAGAVNYSDLYKDGAGIVVLSGARSPKTVAWMSDHGVYTVLFRFKRLRNVAGRLNALSASLPYYR